MTLNEVVDWEKERREFDILYEQYKKDFGSLADIDYVKKPSYFSRFKNYLMNIFKTNW